MEFTADGQPSNGYTRGERGPAYGDLFLDWPGGHLYVFLYNDHGQLVAVPATDHPRGLHDS